MDKTPNFIILCKNCGRHSGITKTQRTYWKCSCGWVCERKQTLEERVKKLEKTSIDREAWLRDCDREIKKLTPSATCFIFYKGRIIGRIENVTIKNHDIVLKLKVTSCFKCGYHLSTAPGIGTFCPNKNCEVCDDVGKFSVEDL